MKQASFFLFISLFLFSFSLKAGVVADKDIEKLRHIYCRGYGAGY